MPEDLFKIQRYCLHIMGHDFNMAGPIGGKPAECATRKRFMYYAHLLLVASAQWPLLSYVKHNLSDVELATAGVSVALTNFISVVKIVTFLSYKPKFSMMLQRLTQLNEEVQATAAKNRLYTVNATAKRFTLIYTLACIGTGVYFHLMPIVKILWCSLMQLPMPRELPMPMKFIFDHEQTGWYMLAYCYIAAVTFNVINYACSIDGFFFVFAMNISGHLQALQYFITTNLCRSTTSQQNVSDFAQYHALLLELTASVQEIFTPIVFCQFLMTSLNVCVVIYQMVSNLNSMIVLLNYATFLAAILCQLFIYCYGGEMLKEQSSLVSTSIAYGNWHELRPQQRRMLLFLIKRSQRVVIIRAGFYEASLANFLTIIQAAISYITIIQSIE